MPEPMAPVTGIARGGLGTATNLDDTQRYSVEDLAPPEPGFDEPVLDEPALVDPSPTIALVRAHDQPKARAREVPRARPRATGLSARPVAIGAFAILALAAVLTLRDGGLFEPGSGGGVLGGQDTVIAAPAATSAPKPTKAPEAGGKGHGNGHGGGHDH